MGISRKQLHVPVLPLHVPEGPFLGGGHPDGLRGLSRGRGLRGRRGRGSRRRLRGLGSRCWDGLFGRHCLRRLGAVFGAGGSTSSLGGCGCRGLGRRRGLSRRGTVAGAGSGSGSAGSADSAAGSAATGGSAFSAISFSEYFIARGPGILQRKRWSRGYLPHCRLHLSI